MKVDIALWKGTDTPPPRDEVQGPLLSQNQARERMNAAIEGLDAQEDEPRLIVHAVTFV